MAAAVDTTSDSSANLKLRLQLLQKRNSSITDLAVESMVAAVPGDRRLMRRFRDNFAILQRAYQDLTAYHRRGEPVSNVADWLLDNYYVIKSVVRQVRVHLPRGYYRELPAMQKGPDSGLPRVFALAKVILTRAEGVLSEQDLRAEVKAFQQITTLTIGEVWAIPTMLRLAIIETIRTLADDILRTREEMRHALTDLERARSGRLRELPRTATDAYRLAFWDGLKTDGLAQDAEVDLVEEWAKAHLAEIADVAHREHTRLAAEQLAIGNAVTNLRVLEVIDWMTFFEDVNAVEAILRTDPNGVYAAQDFATRDRCRRAVEELAKGSGRAETDVARLAVAMASQHATDPVRGYVIGVLLGEDRESFEKQLGYRQSWSAFRQTFALQMPYRIYFGSIGFLLATFLLATLVVSSPPTWWLGIVILLLSLVPGFDMAIAVTQEVVRQLVPPRVLPKLDWKTAIPSEWATFVVVPTLIARPAQATGLLERLELHYLSNPDDALRFALLTDLTDAATETTAEDIACVASLVRGVEKLNQQYAAPDTPRFFVFHRRRQFNPAEGKWMGWERKRGKLDEFNRLLRGATDTNYTTTFPTVEKLPLVRFVLTLDTDTVLPRDAARHMIATLAHPLNRPRLSADGRRVEAGYAVLQPRVSFLYQTGFRSWFARLFAGSAGVDPYSTASSDTYMDLFGRGSFTGKGLYDLNAFTATAGHAFPDNSILSHDLIESNYARCALATDIEVYDEFPARYHAYARREHRWIRGDWQLLPWLGRKVPTPRGRAANVLPLLERWKVLDNLRRSLFAPALLVLLVAGWTVLPGHAWAWTLFAMLPLAYPTLAMVRGGFAALLRKRNPRVAWAELKFDLGNTAGQGLLRILFLLNEAVHCVDAIVRTLYRLAVSRRRMLEWESAATTDRRLKDDLRAYVGAMRTSLGLTLVLAALVAWAAPRNLLAAVPLLIAWLLAPLVAYRVSQPRTLQDQLLTDDQTAELHRIARRTWDFFETFVGTEDNGLPPDNYQESPLGVSAHRTSPTNIGLYVLAVQAARDFGYVTPDEMCDRLERAFDSLDKLERHRGHFLNWYDTSNLSPLLPAYVSTVDSGNLLACLLALTHGLDRDAPAAVGVADTLVVLLDEMDFEKCSSPSHRDALIAAVRDGDRTAILKAIDHLRPLIAVESESNRWLNKLVAHVERSVAAPSAELPQRLAKLKDRARRYADEMDFRFLFNAERELFVIGYNVTANRFDPNYYDLLASEACIASFLAVARGEVARKHWFRLGRLATRAAGGTGLVSWGGTMFEYLMPRLLLPIPRGVLLDEAERTAVRRQIEYGRQIGLPWGISESGFAIVDAGQVYQYQSFGVPGLGLKRGLDRDRVISPYATLLAVDVDPASAIENLRRIRSLGGEGKYGFYEALDFTPDRTEGTEPSVVKSYMAHHQGMGFIAIANRLHGGTFRNRLRAEPVVKAAELLLEERVPVETPFIEPPDTADGANTPTVATGGTSKRRIASPETPTPRTHLLSNGHYSVMVTNAGGGYSAWNTFAVTRWRPDSTTDEFGQFVYVRDRQTGAYWSAGYQPTKKVPKSFEAVYAVDKAEFRRIDDDIETVMEVAVAPDRDLEVRRVVVTNLGDRSRSLDLTSYAEVVLDTQAADVAHPAFGKLFLETEWLAASAALLVRRRPRSPSAPAPWAFHATVGAQQGDEVSWDSDRVQVLGRRRSNASPAMLDASCVNLGETSGAVLDPALALRRHFKLPPGGRQTVSFVTGAAANREQLLNLLESVATPAAVDHVFELAWAHSRIELQHSQLKSEDVHLFQRLAGYLLYPVGPLRAPREVIAANRQPQSGLWRFGISGDWPIALLRLNGPDGLPLMRQLLQAHHFWVGHGLKADVIVLLENAGGYFDELHNQTMNLIRSVVPAERQDRPSGVFVRKGWQMNEADHLLLQSFARVVLDDRSGSLDSQADRLPPPQSIPPRWGRKHGPAASTEPAATTHAHFANGYGAFSDDGHEYRIGPCVPPLPWANVIANPAAGFIVTDSGGGYAWAGNSQTNRLTPWSNDPCLDPPGDCFFVQDVDTTWAWSPTPLPCAVAPVEVRHGAGYSVFTSRQDGLEHELTVFVPTADPVKCSRLKLRNIGNRIRHVAVFYYAELVLGSTRSATAQHVVTEVDPDTGAVMARNAFVQLDPSPVAFVDCDTRPRTVTGDRTEFLGRNGDLRAPAALERVALSGRVGAGYDPCVALRGTLILAPGEERTVVAQIGQAASVGDVRRIVSAYRGTGADRALEAVVQKWRHFADAVRITTPDSAFNSLMNQWLPYQVLSCRVWGRSAVYQSGGAFGYRDQLQDVAALVHAAPGIARDHILRAAARQFLEGDVQHWWHEPGGAGVRTRISDDLLWLPYVVEHYAAVTGDHDIWDRAVSFLSGRLLESHEHEIFDIPRVSEESGSIYEHCVRALKRGWTLGPHGLPLIGTGDWNDGLNEVGSHGRGESVWLAWFQIVVLQRFAPVAKGRGDAKFAEECRQHAEKLRAAVEQHAWDGRWYRRAYFDDGSPLGSATNDECRIDSLAQTWSVFAQVADKDRTKQAMDEAMRQLVKHVDRLVLLFTPPFDAGPQQPGYIKGYVPGVRENGGQYTHAAAWVIQALAELGYGDEAFATFDLLNPASITATGAGVCKYKGEPYVVAGDVYSLAAHRGRVGWTWYTGSAGWLYRVGLESILGLRRSGDVLEFRPCLPAVWKSVELQYRYSETTYVISILNPNGASGGHVAEVTLDGAAQASLRVRMADDRVLHTVQVRLV